MFRLEEVSKVYTKNSEQIVALRVAALQIAEGDYAAVVGPSGSGKSTLLSLLGGMLAPTTGQVWFDDKPLYEVPLDERARIRREKIGFVFQSFNLVPYLTALENVQLPLFLSGAAATEQRQRAERLLHRVGLESRMHHKPFELSIGQQQRVALARTLANDPRVILADEPTGNLDPENRQLVLDTFDAFHAEGRTILMVTHDPAAAKRAGRVLKLENGQAHEVTRERLLKSA